VNKTEETGRVE